MLRLIGLITIVVILVLNSEKVKLCVDFSSGICTAFRNTTKDAVNHLDRFYSKSLSPVVEKVKSFDVPTP